MVGFLSDLQSSFESLLKKGKPEKKREEHESEEPESGREESEKTNEPRISIFPKFKEQLKKEIKDELREELKRELRTELDEVRRVLKHKEL